MSPEALKLSEALSLLSLDEDCTLEELKLSYRQHALRTHPDKNPGCSEATAAFQRVGEAYRVIEAHLERAKHPSGGHGFDPFYEEVDVEDIFFGYSDSEYDSDSDYAGYGIPRDILEFIYLFEALDSGHYRCNCSRHREESPQEYEARLEHSREERLAAEARRTAEAAAQREQKAKEREQERMNTQRRREAKAAQKKAKAKAYQKETEEAIRTQNMRAQVLRSEVFAAARSGDFGKVRDGIWTKGVDAAGGEIKYKELVGTAPGDPLETLLHIAAKKGDIQLFQWLDEHNAEMDERDTRGYTALHPAMFHGHIQIVKYVFEAYPPKEPEYRSVYETPVYSNLLYLAVKSGEPEIVEMVLQNGLFTAQDARSGWSWASQAFDALPDDSEDSKPLNILRLLMRYDSEFTPPPTPMVDPGMEYHDSEFRTQTRGRYAKDSRHTQSQSEERSEHQYRTRGHGRGRGKGHRRGRGKGQAQF